jgi:predicted DNA-binding protein with PD1-like motif
MVFKQINQDYLVRFDKGELLVEGLVKFIKSRAIHPSWIQGLGAALWAEVGSYNLDSQKYSFLKLDQALEIASLTGNVTWSDNEPVSHLHVVLADESLHTYAGHLKELAVGGTCEVFIHTFDQAISSKTDPHTGLKLLDL